MEWNFKFLSHYTTYILNKKEFAKRFVVPANSNGESYSERHCRRTVSCALGAPVKTIVSTQLTHGWPVGPG